MTRCRNLSANNETSRENTVSFTEIKYDVTDRVAVVTLNRPEQLNAWTTVMDKEVREAMEKAAADDNVRVIV